MSSDQLQQILTLTNVGVGQTVVLAHNLRANGIRLAPDEVVFSNPAFLFVSASSTSVTVMNPTDEIQSGYCRVTWFHSFLRAYGAESAPGPLPFVITGTGLVAGSGGGGVVENPITLVAVTDGGDEDETLAGDAFAEASTTVGTLSIMQFTVAGQSGVYQGGETATIASRGTFSLQTDGTYEFIPFANYNGAIPTITFQATNGSDIRISTINITIGAVNDPPVANADARITLVNTPITINVRSNDQDPDNDAITVSQLNGSPVSVGVPVDIGDATVTYLGGNEFEIEPDLDFEGSVDFTYTITDGSLSATATVTVLVGAANDPMFSSAAPISSALDNAAYNFGLTFMGRIGSDWNNGVNVAIPPYTANQGLFDLANREPWLYDRASTAYTLYLRTQDETILDHAISLADQYMAGVSVSGSNLGGFTIVGGDPNANPADIKYLYPIIGVWYEKETGSAVHRNRSIALYNQSLLSFSKTYNPVSAALWTERNAGYAIQACTAAYWLHWSAGNPTAAATALADAWDYFEMVEGMSAASGAPLHGHNQHEGSAITTPITSPWMSAFLAESLVQLYRTDPDDSILEWLSNYGDFLLDNAFYVTDEGDIAGIQGLRLPAYLVANTGTPETFREGELLDMEHAQDVAGLIKKVIWAKTELSLPTGDFTDLLEELETVAAEVFAYWTRTTEGFPRYRVTPPRKYGWWFRNAYSDVALFFTEQVPAPPLLVSGITISGSTQSGSTLTATPGTWVGTPTPTYSRQWYRDGIAIVGETGLTYDTDVIDEGTAITIRETATNAAGAVFDDSNTINVVPAGAPEVTVHPSNASAQVSETAEFSAECAATPTAAFQWQVSTNNGSSWNNVAEGTGGSGTANTTTYTTEALAENDNGDLYRCVFTNIHGSVSTNAATLAMTIDQGAARFTSNTTGAELVFDIGGEGHTNFVLELLAYFEGNTIANQQFFGVRHTGNGRAMGVGTDNTFEVYNFSLGDSNTGWTAWASQPPLNTWLHVTLQSPNTPGGTIRATWTEAEDTGAARFAVTRANGIEGSVQALATWIGGDAIGVPGQDAIRFQYVRGRTGYLDNTTVDGHRQDTDASAWDFWWRFFDDGGNLGVEDLSGNNRVPTLTGGTFEEGPVVPSAG